MAGNPNPSPATRFKPGESGNPGGKTSEHRKAEIRAAELAALVQLEWMESLFKLVKESKEDSDKIAYINKEMNTLVKNAQDRGFGAPQQHVDNTSSDGSASLPSRIILTGPDDDS